MLVTACPKLCRLLKDTGCYEHVCLLQVMFDATMLLAQEYRAMLARAQQRSAEKLTEQLRKVRTPSSLFPKILRRPCTGLAVRAAMPDVSATVMRQGSQAAFLVTEQPPKKHMI